MKKVFSLLFVAVIFLAACSGSDNGELSGSITVGISGTPTEIQTYKDLGEKFTEETGVEVEFRQYTDFNTEIQAELIGKTAPDVFPLDSYIFPTFVEQGSIMKLDKSNFDIDQYDENLLDSFTYEGDLYSLPKDYSTLAIYYNKEYVNEEDLPDSYEELGSYLKDLDKSLPDDVVPMTINVDLARQMYLAQASGDLIIDEETGYSQLDNDNIEQNLSLEMDLAKEGLMVTPADLGVGWNGEAFGSGKTAIMLEGNWVYGELNKNYSDIDFGVKENFTVDGNKGSMLFTVGWNINSSTDQDAEALEFIKFMSTQENSKYQTEQNGTLPARKDVADELGLSENEDLGPHVAASEYATVWQSGVTLDTVNREYMNYVPGVISKKSDLRESLKKTDEEANAIIKENK